MNKHSLISESKRSTLIRVASLYKMSDFFRIGSNSQSQTEISREEEQIYAGYFANDIETLFSRRDSSQPVDPLYEDPAILWDRLPPILGTFFGDVFHDWDSFRALYQTLDLRVDKPTSHRQLSQVPAAIHTPNWKDLHSSEGQLQANRNTEPQRSTSSKHQHILPKHTSQKRPREAPASSMREQVYSGQSRSKDGVELLPSCCWNPADFEVNYGYVSANQDYRQGIWFTPEDQHVDKRYKFQPDIGTDRVRKIEF